MPRRAPVRTTDLDLETLTLHQDGRVLTARFDDPPNQFLSLRLVKDMDRLTRAADEDPTVGAVILTGTGEVLTASPTVNPELYRTFPNSYGTLGYSVRLKIALEPVAPFVALTHLRFHSTRELLSAMDRIIDTGGQPLEHACVEVLLDGVWQCVDSHVVDMRLAVAAKTRLALENRTLGYGMHVLGATTWDGRGDSFGQFHPDDPDSLPRHHVVLNMVDPKTTRADAALIEAAIARFPVDTRYAAWTSSAANATRVMPCCTRLPRFSRSTSGRYCASSRARWSRSKWSAES